MIQKYRNNGNEEQTFDIGYRRMEIFELYPKFKNGQGISGTYLFQHTPYPKRL
jgi:hypothetical protein